MWVIVMGGPEGWLSAVAASQRCAWNARLRPISDTEDLDFVALKPSVKERRNSRSCLCQHGPATYDQIFKVAFTLSHSIDKDGFRSSKMVDDSVIPALALAVSYIDKASRACALN